MPCYGYAMLCYGYAMLCYAMVRLCYATAMPCYERLERAPLRVRVLEAARGGDDALVEQRHGADLPYGGRCPGGRHGQMRKAMGSEQTSSSARSPSRGSA